MHVARSTQPLKTSAHHHSTDVAADFLACVVLSAPNQHVCHESGTTPHQQRPHCTSSDLPAPAGTAPYWYRPHRQRFHSTSRNRTYSDIETTGILPDVVETKIFRAGTVAQPPLEPNRTNPPGFPALLTRRRLRFLQNGLPCFQLHVIFLSSRSVHSKQSQEFNFREFNTVRLLTPPK